MPAQYQVVAECAHATIDTPSGRAVVLLMKGALVPAGAPELKRLLDLGFVAKTGGDETGGVDAAGIPAAAYDTPVPTGLTTTPVETSGQPAGASEAAEENKADAEVAEKRAAAAAKLPADGSAPDGRAGKDVLVEYLAGRGYLYDELVKQDVADLRSLVKQQS